MIRVKQSDPMQHLDQLQKAISRFYDHEPWSDNYICSACHPPIASTMLSWWDHKVQCPGKCELCRQELNEFWSMERFRVYLQDAMSNHGFVFLGAFNDEDSNKLVGWLWGYGKNITKHDSFYIDMIGVEESYRRHGGVRDLALQALFILKMRLSPLQRLSVLDIPLERLGMPIVARLFLSLLKETRGRYEAMATQTHESAINVIKVLRLAGFRQVSAPTRFPNRVIFQRVLH